MAERSELSVTPDPEIRERPYTTLRGVIIRGTAFIGLSGAIMLGYGINRSRLEESSANQEKTRITREFYKTNPDPNPGQLFELKDKVDNINKFSTTTVITTTVGGPLMSLGLFASGLAWLHMGEESRPSDRKKRKNQPSTSTL